ncbi:MAG: hypothetical protein AABZ39_09755 [Spirochaetota bacterium]
MKIVAITGKEQSEIKDVPDPVIRTPFAKIKITRVPLCTEWKNWVDGSVSETLGHEAVGIIAAQSHFRPSIAWRTAYRRWKRTSRSA